MPILTGKEALAFHEQLKTENSNSKRAQLSKAKRDADAIGKESFDLSKLEELCDTSMGGHMLDDEEQRAVYEYGYYVEHPEVRTIVDYSKLISELGKWA
jgi:hypothetical protein